MNEPIRGCSGPPGFTFDGSNSTPCNWAPAVVVLVDRGNWDRPMCLACARRFVALCAREALPTPRFYLHDQAEIDDAESGGTRKPPAIGVPSSDPTLSVAQQPEVSKAGGADHSHCACNGYQKADWYGGPCVCGHADRAHEEGGPARVCRFSANACPVHSR